MEYRLIFTVNHKTLKIMKILIVEDNCVNIQLYKMYLRNYDVEILTASNGLEGVELFRNNPDINFILMNYEMPIMNGIEATIEIRKFNKDIVIVMVSASFGVDKKLQEDVMKSGCNDYILIPMNFTTSAEKIEYYNLR